MKTTAIILFVNVVYGLMGFLLYRCRFNKDLTLLSSDNDVITFLIPAVIAMVLNGVIIWKALPNRLPRWGHSILTIFIALVLTFFAFWGYMLFGVNIYGE